VSWECPTAHVLVIDSCREEKAHSPSQQSHRCHNLVPRNPLLRLEGDLAFGQYATAHRSKCFSLNGDGVIGLTGMTLIEALNNELF